MRVPTSLHGVGTSDIVLLIQDGIYDRRYICNVYLAIIVHVGNSFVKRLGLIAKNITGYQGYVSDVDFIVTIYITNQFAELFNLEEILPTFCRLVCSFRSSGDIECALFIYIIIRPPYENTFINLESPQSFHAEKHFLFHLAFQ